MILHIAQRPASSGERIAYRVYVEHNDERRYGTVDGQLTPDAERAHLLNFPEAISFAQQVMQREEAAVHIEQIIVVGTGQTEV